MNDYAINLVDIVHRMTSIEIQILDSLKNTAFFEGITIEDLLEENLSVKLTTLRNILSKLVFIGAVDYKIELKTRYYYITSIGEDILDILSSL